MQRIFSHGYRRLALGVLAVALTIGVEQCFAPVEANSGSDHVDPVAMQLQQSSPGVKTLTVWIPYGGYYSGGNLQSPSGVQQVQVWDQSSQVWLNLPFVEDDGGGFVFMATAVQGNQFSAPKIGNIYVDASTGSLVCAGQGNLVPNQGCNYPWAQ